MTKFLWLNRVAIASANAGRGLYLVPMPVTDEQYTFLSAFCARDMARKNAQMVDRINAANAAKGRKG